ncbi:MAG TPA: tetratricopeptide repeat protein [bacterium]|nr:tetratricopeptide repeat protein [bacterium]
MESGPISGWRVETKLGEGGTSKVYAAWTPEGEKVAVKVLSDPGQRPLLEHEAKLLVRLRHPAIAPVLGYAKDSGHIFGQDRGPCFWMEYVEGEDLLSAAGRSRDPGKIQNWLCEALEALDFLHSQGVLHGDLSPGNLRVDSKGGLRLIDFGTASLAGSNAASRAATVLYLAPERIGGKNGPACDLFSLGTLFYEALAGVHPRAGCRSLSEMVRKPARSVLDVRPDLATSHALLARAVDRMILADPAARFSEAREVLEALRGGRPEPSRVPAFHPVWMFGASEALETVGRAVETIGKRSRFFALHGVTGVGKKRFLREIGFQCALAGRTVREILPGRFKKGVEELPGASGAVFFRSLEDVPAGDLAGLLRVTRKSAPDKDVLVIWEWNDDGLKEDARRVLEGFASHPDIEEVLLRNLSEADARELVLSALPGAPAAEAEKTAATLHRMTGGNPLMLLESLRLDSAPSDFHAVLKIRIRESTALERRLLELLAAAPGPVEADPLFQALGGDALDAVVALDRLSSRGLVALEADTGRYRLGMAGLREAVLEDLPGDDQLDRHRDWWRALSGEGEASPARLHHALALGDADFAARSAHGVVERLWRSKRCEEALKLADGALSLVRRIPDDVETSRLLRLKVNLLNELGRFGETLPLCEEIRGLAAADEPAALKTVKYWLITGLGHQNLGDHGEAEKRFRRCLEECGRLGDQVPRTYAMRCHSLIGMEALRRDDLREAGRQFAEGLAFEEFRGWRRAEICRNLAVVRHAEGDVENALNLLEEARRLYADEANGEGVYATWLQEGNLALERGDFEACARAYAEAEAVAAAREDDLFLASVWNNEGILERHRGDLARSLDRLQKALEVFRPLGNWGDLAESLKQNAITEVQVGRFESAERRLAEIRALVARLPQAAEKAREVEEALREFRGGEGLPEADAAAKARLRALYDRLPKALQVSFEDRFDFKKWIRHQGKDAP